MPERAVGEGDVKQTEGSVDDDDEAEFVEVDPTGRYGRYGEVLGRGAFKTVYRAFDEVDGIEVAWNKVRVQDVLRNPADLERLYSEVHLLKTLKHKNIIKFYTSWVDAKSKDVNFITEIFTSGTLRQYRKKHKHVDIKAVKNWARQILRGLLYLHSHDPPVIHRDLKCDNIFVNGHQGEVKIGDLGLATILHRAQAAHSVIGTPEFMAPELYEEEYNELVDIYSFGMCVLEMVTFEYPYSECANAAQIFKKVTSGIRPAALDKVKDPEVRSFVEKCLATASRRLPARELLMDPFLCCEGDRESTECSTTLQSSQSTTDLRTLEKCVADQISHSKSDLGCQKRCGDKTSSDNGPSSPTHSETSTLSSFAGSLLRSRDFVVKGRRREDDTVFLRVRIADHNGRNRNIHFPFDIEADSALSVASEMVAELDLSDQDVTTIADMIDAEVLALVPDWKPGASFDENGDDGFGQTDIPCPDEWQQRGPPVQNTHENTMYGRFEELSCLSVESQHCLSDLSAMSSGDSFSNVDDSSIAELSLSSARQNNANVVDMTNDVDCNVVLKDVNSSEYTGQQDSTGTYSFNELVEAKRNSASEKSVQIWEGIVVHDCSVEACTCHDCMGTGVSGLVDQSHVDNICLNAFLEASAGTAFEQAEVVETLSTVTAIGQAMIVGTLSSSLQENKHGALPVEGSDATKSGSFITDGMEASADSLIEDPSHLLKLLALRHQQELEQLQHKHEQALLELKNSFKRSKNTDCELVSAPEMQLGSLVVQLDGAELSNRLLIPEEARAPVGSGNNGEITTGMVLCRTQLDVAEQNNQCPLKNICNGDFVNPLYDSEVKLISLQTGALNQAAVPEMPNAGECNLDSDFISGIECRYKVGLHEEQMVCTISSNSVLEQLKREQLQKSIADMEARTLENLQQSYKNGYSVSAAGKKKVVGALHGSLAG